MPIASQHRQGRERQRLLITLSALLLGSGCNEGPLPVDESAPAGATAQETPLVPADREAFEAYMTAALQTLEPPTSLPLPDSVSAPPGLLPVEGSSRVDLPFSTTNLQTQLVDESDPVKFDGRYLFVSHPPVLGFVSPRVVPPGGGPGAPATLDGRFYYPEYEVIEPASISVHLAKSDPPSTVERMRIELAGAVRIHGLVLLPGEGDHPPLLSVIATRGGQLAPMLDFADPWSAGEGQVHLWIYDVSDPEAPVRVHRLRLEGLPIAVRRLGDSLVLVTRFSPYLHALAPYALEPETRREMVEDVALEQLLPRAWLGDDDEADGGNPLVVPERCFVPEVRADSGHGLFYRPTLITITTIALRDPDDRVSVCAAGPVDRVFSSVDALYLAASSYMRSAETIVHKFRYLEHGPAFRGSGRVAGRPGGSQWSFGLGEHDGVFGIMTTVYAPTLEGRFEEQHRLSLLREASSDGLRLEEIAHLPNEREPAPIGKPGEDLHAVRFVGPRVYAVTFRKIDPLYVIDIASPENPFIAGELVVPGFSDYLQPIGEDWLLGIGKDTVPDVANDWFQGVKIELFDVSDPGRPESAHALVVGRRGSETDARWDHQAVSVLEVEPGAHRIALPISVHEELPANGDPDDPRSYWGWSYTGLHLFEVREQEGELVELGAVVAAPGDDPATFDSRSTRGDRSRLQGDAVHYLHDGQIFSETWGASSR